MHRCINTNIKERKKFKLVIEISEKSASHHDDFVFIKLVQIQKTRTNEQNKERKKEIKAEPRQLNAIFSLHVSLNC